jgi:hypothetical protein
MKKVFSVVLIAALLFAATEIRAQHAHHAEYAHDNVHLQANYAEYNETFFNNTLPKNVSVSWYDIPIDADGRYILGDTSEGPIGSFRIHIDTKTNITWATTDVTLLHEMCHVKTNDYAIGHDEPDHGPSFKACIVNLELQGAYTDLL